VIASGGGVKNPFLMKCLREELPEKLSSSRPRSTASIRTSKRPSPFAVLAYETCLRPRLQRALGYRACHSVVLGKVSYSLFSGAAASLRPRRFDAAGARVGDQLSECSATCATLPIHTPCT